MWRLLNNSCKRLIFAVSLCMYWVPIMVMGAYYRYTCQLSCCGSKTFISQDLASINFSITFLKSSSYQLCTQLNPLTPMPAITCSRDERWPVFKFCRRKTSFQWHLDQSDLLSGAWNMQENAQKFDWKTQSKIACNHTWPLHGKICLYWWCFLRIFLTGSKPSRRSITAAEIWGKEKKEWCTKKFKKQEA